MNKRANLAAALQSATRGGEAAPAGKTPAATLAPIGPRTHRTGA